MVDVCYECDQDGIIHGSVTNGLRIILFTVSTDAMMHGKDRGLNVLDEMVIASLKELTDHPTEDSADVRAMVSHDEDDVLIF